MPATATDRLNNLTTSVAIKPACRVATTTSITLSGLQTVDGEVLAADDRVLVKDGSIENPGSDSVDNGIYEANTSAWTRAPDFNGALDAVQGTLVIVYGGATNGRSVWELTTDNPVVIGTSDLTFEKAILSDSATAAFIQAGADAVQRTAQDKMRERVSVFDFMTEAQIADVVARTELLDVRAPIQAAIDYIITEGGGELLFPGGRYRIDDTLYVTNSVFFQGVGLGDADGTASPTSHVTHIRWNGTDVGAGFMIEVMSDTPSEYVHNWGIDKIFLDGGNKAWGGLHLASCRSFNVGRLLVERCRHRGWLIDDSNGVVGGAFGQCDFYYYNSRSNAATLASGGLKITQVSSTGCTSMNFNHLLLVTVDGNGLDLGNTDNNVFGKVNTIVTGTGDGVLFRGLTDGQLGVSRKNVIWQYSGHNIRAQAGSLNWIGMINSEGTSVDCDANASLQYSVIDRNDGRRYTTPLRLTHETLYLPISQGYAHTGSPALTTYGTSLTRGVAFDPAAAAETWQWVIPPLPQWSEGRILGLTVWGAKSSVTNAGNIVMQAGALMKSTASGMGAGYTTENKTHAVDAAAALTFETFDIDFATPVALPAACHLLVQLTRLGSNVADTYPDDWAAITVAVRFQANVAKEGATDYRYAVPTDIVV